MNDHHLYFRGSFCAAAAEAQKMFAGAAWVQLAANRSLVPTAADRQPRPANLIDVIIIAVRMQQRNGVTVMNSQGAVR
jgi:hypothetical protein